MKATNRNKLTIASLLLSTCFLLVPGAHAKDKVIAAKDVEWGYLNPARGDKSPGAADLWGDRTKDTATGMLVRFNKGFESPPHIHNITYRGIVIEGEMHNDDPNAAKMWMPTGSFWTQPAGENHTTAANDKTNLIYLEIDEGPYLVKPSKEYFDNGERPINVHADNIVWLQKSDLVNIAANGVSVAYLWGETSSVYGTLVKLPKGFKGSIKSSGDEFKAVVIKGNLNYKQDSKTEALPLDAGSYIESSTPATHVIRNVSDDDAIVYVRSSSMYHVKN
ncbi:MAG: DUF4437 domain-containing protein [Pseudomonadota bacterium]|nr:DUF4437 domain-containing protein [Pseudomonadota bacterium]